MEKQLFLFLELCFFFGLMLNGQNSNKEKLPELLEGEWKVYALNDTINPLNQTLEGKIVSMGNAVYTTYKSSGYEANSLWSYDKKEKIIYALETKSNGLVWIQKGFFDDAGRLILKRFSKENEELLVQKTTMEWLTTYKIKTKVEWPNNPDRHSFQFYFIKR